MRSAHLPPEAAAIFRPSVMVPIISGHSAASRTLTPITKLSRVLRGMEGLSLLPSTSSLPPPATSAVAVQLNRLSHSTEMYKPVFFFGFKATGGGSGLSCPFSSSGPELVGVASSSSLFNLPVISVDNPFITFRGWAGPHGGGGACLLLPTCPNRLHHDDIIITTSTRSYLRTIRGCLAIMQIDMFVNSGICNGGNK